MKVSTAQKNVKFTYVPTLRTKIKLLNMNLKCYSISFLFILLNFSYYNFFNIQEMN